MHESSGEATGFERQPTLRPNVIVMIVECLDTCALRTSTSTLVKVSEYIPRCAAETALPALAMYHPFPAIHSAVDEYRSRVLGRSTLTDVCRSPFRLCISINTEKEHASSKVRTGESTQRPGRGLSKCLSRKKPTQRDVRPVTNQEARTEENTRQPHVQGSIREVCRVELRDVEREAVDLNVPQPRILRHVEGHTWGWEQPSDARTKMSSRFELARAALVISLDGGVGGWGAGERIFDRPTVTARLKPGDMGLRDQRRHVCRRWTTCSSETGD